MKKLLIVLFLSVAFLGVKAQKLVTIDADSINGAETVYFTTDEITDGWQTCTIQALCTEVAGTTDGTMTLEGSVDGTSFVPLTDQSGLVKGYPKDSLTMTDAAVQVWIIEKTPFAYFRIKVAGTESDTTLITPYYLLKD